MSKDPGAFFRDMMAQWSEAAKQFGADAMKSEEVSRAMANATASTAAAQAAMAEQVEKALAAANLPSKRDIAAIETRLAGIEASLSRIETALAATPAAPPKPRKTKARKDD